MTKENLIFNFKGDKYWEPFFNDESGKLNMYEGHHGNYVGLVMKHTISSFGRNEYDEYESYQAFRTDYDLSLTVSVNFSQEIINLHDGTYIGEILNGRLIVNEDKEKRIKIKENIFYRPFGRLGYFSQPKQETLPVPQGYHDFDVGWV